MLAERIEKSRADARTQGLKQFVVVERFLAEKEIGEAVCANLRHYLAANGLNHPDNEVMSIEAIETTKSMVVWEMELSHEDGEQVSMFDSTRHYQVVTDFEGELVRIVRPFYRDIKKVRCGITYPAN